MEFKNGTSSESLISENENKNIINFIYISTKFYARSIKISNNIMKTLKVLQIITVCTYSKYLYDNVICFLFILLLECG